jgi:hypothetical protein
MIKLKLTVSVEYNADPANYDTEDPQEMARIDQYLFKNNITDAFELLDTKGSKVEVSVGKRIIKKDKK